MSRLRLAASFAVVTVALGGTGWWVVQAYPLRGWLEPVVLPPVPAALSYAAAPPARPMPVQPAAPGGRDEGVDPAAMRLPDWSDQGTWAATSAPAVPDVAGTGDARAAALPARGPRSS